MTILIEIDFPTFLFIFFSYTMHKLSPYRVVDPLQCNMHVTFIFPFKIFFLCYLILFKISSRSSMYGSLCHWDFQTWFSMCDVLELLSLNSLELYFSQTLNCHPHKFCPSLLLSCSSASFCSSSLSLNFTKFIVFLEIFLCNLQFNFLEEDYTTCHHALHF